MRLLQQGGNAVDAAIAGEGRSVPAGAVDVGERRYNLKGTGDYASVEDVAETVVAEREGRPVRLRDIASVGWSTDEPRERARYNGVRAAFVTANMKDGYSIFDVQDGHCIADSFRNAGVTWERANKGPGSRANGWALIRERLTAAKKTPPESPALYVFDHCRDFIRTLPMLPRSPKNPDDIDTNAEDHIADEVRYRVLAAPPPEVSSFSIW